MPSPIITIAQLNLTFFEYCVDEDHHQIQLVLDLRGIKEIFSDLQPKNMLSN